MIEAQRSGLSRVLQASAKVQNAATLKLFSSTVLEQLTSLLHLDRSALYCLVLPGEGHSDRETRTLAATGEFAEYQAGSSLEQLPAQVAARFRQVLAQRQAQHFDDAYVMYMADERGGANLLYVTHVEPLSELDRQLLEIYIHNVALTFENINLMEDLQETSKELVYTLADVANCLQNVNATCKAVRYGRSATACSVVPVNTVGRCMPNNWPSERSSANCCSSWIPFITVRSSWSVPC